MRILESEGYIVMKCTAFITTLICIYHPGIYPIDMSNTHIGNDSKKYYCKELLEVNISLMDTHTCDN